MDQPCVLPPLLHPLDRAVAGVRGVVVDDPRDGGAEAHGSTVIACPTNRPYGSIAVLASTRSHRLAWWTSQAASTPGCRLVGCRTRTVPASAARVARCPQRLRLSVLVGAHHVLVGTQAAGPGSDGGRGRAPGPPSRRRRPRTQIQKRRCHGFRASSCSQRQLVAADSSLRPCWTTSSSLCEKLKVATPPSPAAHRRTALTAAICSGGNGAGSPNL